MKLFKAIKRKTYPAGVKTPSGRVYDVPCVVEFLKINMKAVEREVALLKSGYCFR